jgi:hypothetical protein
MADMTRPAGEPADEDGRPVEDATPAGDRIEAPVTPGSSTTASVPADTAVYPRNDAAETAVIPPAAETRPVDERSSTPPPPPPAPVPAEPLEPAEEDAPPPPRVRSNRLAGAAWVLLAAGLFELLFFGVNALVVVVFGGGGPAVVAQVNAIARSPLAWLPVVLFFLLFMLTVLLFNRAGRVAYVIASLVVAVLVYVLTVLLFSLLVRSSLGDTNTLAQTFLNWEFILIGLVARETMLWTGLAIGSRGIRIRRRNKEDRARYEQGLADARA